MGEGCREEIEIRVGSRGERTGMNKAGGSGIRGIFKEGGGGRRGSGAGLAALVTGGARLSNRRARRGIAVPPWLGAC